MPLEVWVISTCLRQECVGLNLGRACVAPRCFFRFWGSDSDHRCHDQMGHQPLEREVLPTNLKIPIHETLRKTVNYSHFGEETFRPLPFVAPYILWMDEILHRFEDMLENIVYWQLQVESSEARVSSVVRNGFPPSTVFLPPWLHPNLPPTHPHPAPPNDPPLSPPPVPPCLLVAGAGPCAAAAEAPHPAVAAMELHHAPGPRPLVQPVHVPRGRQGTTPGTGPHPAGDV